MVCCKVICFVLWPCKVHGALLNAFFLFFLDSIGREGEDTASSLMWTTDLPQCEGSDGVWGATITVLCSFPIYKLVNSSVSVARVGLQGW